MVPEGGVQPGVLLLSRNVKHAGVISVRDMHDGRVITISVTNAKDKARRAISVSSCHLRRGMAQIVDSVMGHLITGKTRERLIEKWLKESKEDDTSEDTE